MVHIRLKNTSSGTRFRFWTFILEVFEKYLDTDLKHVINDKFNFITFENKFPFD